MNLLWVAVVSALAACGGSQPPAPTPTVVGNEAPAPDEQAPTTPAKRSVPTCANDETNCSLLAMRYFRDEMCDCASRADKDCAERVTDEMTTWAQEAARTSSRRVQWSENDSRDMEMLGKQLGECTTTALMPASTASTSTPPSTPPGRQIPVGPPPGPKPSCGNTPSCAMDTVVWFADAMCACTTKQCAQDVTDEMTKWAQQASTQTSSSAKPSSADVKKMEAVGKRLGECTTDVMMNTP